MVAVPLCPIFPPTPGGATLAALGDAHISVDAIPTYWAGDLNLQALDPRDGEALDVAAWFAFLQRHNASGAAVRAPRASGAQVSRRSMR